MDLIEKKDNQFDKLADQVGIKLGSLLQKPQQEMIFMLKRHNLLGKKNKQKLELEKLVQLIKYQVETSLKQQNRKSETVNVELDALKADFSLTLSQEVKSMITNFKRVVQDFVKLHNDYCRMKIGEEKAKAKKPKMNEGMFDKQLTSKYEQMSFETEMARICKELVKNCPEAVQPILQKNHLNLLLGLKVEQSVLPKLGSVWNTVKVFPMSGTAQNKR